MNSTDFDPLDCAAAPHPGSKGSQDRSPTGSRAGVEDENRGVPITARAALPVADSRQLAAVNLFIASG